MMSIPVETALNALFIYGKNEFPQNQPKMTVCEGVRTLNMFFSKVRCTWKATFLFYQSYAVQRKWQNFWIFTITSSCIPWSHMVCMSCKSYTVAIFCTVCCSTEIHFQCHRQQLSQWPPPALLVHAHPSSILNYERLWAREHQAF